MRKALKWVEIDVGAFASNLRWVRRRLAKGVRLMAVVKSDAYGHGAERVSRLALAQGADCLGVLTLSEARLLRRAGIRRRIVVLSPPLPEEAPEVAASGVEPTVDSMGLARALARAAKKPVPIHLDVDFGLGRWGVPAKEALAMAERISRLKKLKLTGLSSHLDYVPGKNAVEAEEKLSALAKLGVRLKKEHPELQLHCANSSIFLDFPHWQMDMVRIGNLIYGLRPGGGGRQIGLKDPWKLFARIVSVRTIRKGDSIGYGSEYLAPRRITVAALPIGYSDGLTMEPAERFIGFGRSFHYWGILRGKKVPFVGRCGISHVLVDVSGVRSARIGDVVKLPIRRTAASPRLPRIYSS